MGPPQPHCKSDAAPHHVGADCGLQDKWNTPCLVIHNDLDFRLPLSEGISAFNVLQRKGIPSKLLRFPDEGHWVNSYAPVVSPGHAISLTTSRPSNAKRWTDEVLGFIGEWTPASARPSGYDVGYTSVV